MDPVDPDPQHCYQCTFFYMAPYVMALRSITRATGRGGLWKSRLFWAKGLRAKRVPFGPKKVEFKKIHIHPDLERTGVDQRGLAGALQLAGAHRHLNLQRHVL